MKKIFTLLSLFLIVFSFISCEKDETKATLPDNPTLPVLQTIPNLTLKRLEGNNILKFVGSPLDLGFQASTTYILEACAKGNNFAAPVTLISTNQDTSMSISVSDLNSILLKKFPADQVSEVDIRIKAILNAGAGSQVFEYSSAASTVNITLYGLPRLDIISNDVVYGKIESALGDGKYAGFTKLDNMLSYTLKDPDANVVYGGSDGVLSVNGQALTSTTSGWYKLIVDTKGLTYTLNGYRIGLVGSATVNGWNAPDQKMDYDAATGTWKITVNLSDGEIKFRKNDDWTWNLGGTTSKLEHNGANIAVTAGNYTITLNIIDDVKELGTFTIVKN